MDDQTNWLIGWLTDWLLDLYIYLFIHLTYNPDLSVVSFVTDRHFQKFQSLKACEK